MTYAQLNIPIPEKEPTFLDEALKSVTRKALTSIGAILLYRYGVTADVFDPLSVQIVEVVGGIGAVAYSTLWGVFNKKKLVKQIVEK